MSQSSTNYTTSDTSMQSLLSFSNPPDTLITVDASSQLGLVTVVLTALCCIDKLRESTISAPREGDLHQLLHDPWVDKLPMYP